MRQFILISFLSFTFFSFSGSLLGQGAKMNGMGKCEASLIGGWSIMNNPAGLTSIDQCQFLIDYNQKYLISELGTKAIGMTLPAKNGNWGIAWVSSGFSNFNRNELNLNYALQLTESFDVGLRFSYFRINYGEQISSQQYLSSDLGFQYSPTKNFLIGAFANNISLFGRNVYHYPYHLRPGLSFGVSYRPSAKVLLVSEISKYSLSLFDVKVGLEYEVVKNLFLRIGVYSRNLTHTFGVGCLLKYVEIDIGGERHPFLGYSLNCSFSIILNGKLKKR